MSARRPIGERIVRAGIAVGIAHWIFKIAGFAQSWVVGRHLDNETFDVVYGFAFEGCIFTLFLIGEEVIDHSGLDYYDPEVGTPAPAPAPKPLGRRKKAAAKS